MQSVVSGLCKIAIAEFCVFCYHRNDNNRTYKFVTDGSLVFSLILFSYGRLGTQK